MEWTRQDIKILEEAVFNRYDAFLEEHRTDRKNLSELWNRHILQIGVTGIRPKKKGKGKIVSKVMIAPPPCEYVAFTAHDIVDVINFRNSEVSDALCIRNPDRTEQFLLLSRDVASKIVMLGMP